MTTHTPGPWYSNGSTVRHLDGTPGGQEIAAVPELANARLIAAAPELLEACERGDKLIQLWRETGKPDLHAFMLLQDAFRIVSAKAKQS